MKKVKSTQVTKSIIRTCFKPDKMFPSPICPAMSPQKMDWNMVACESSALSSSLFSPPPIGIPDAPPIPVVLLNDVRSGGSMFLNSR